MTLPVSDFFTPRPPREGHGPSVEDGIVRKILNRFGMSVSGHVSRYRHDTANTLMTAAWFCATYPDFPVRIGYRQVRKQRDLLALILKTPTKLPFFRSWLELLEEVQASGDTRRVGCVFIWPKVGRCVIHDDVTPAEEFSFLKWPVPRIGRTFVIERLKQFLVRLSWEAPEASYDAV